MSATQTGRSGNTHGTRKWPSRHRDDMQPRHVPATGGSPAASRRNLKRETPMLKTLTAIAALAALLAVNITPAHAAIFANGGGENGLQLNGGGENGLQLNGGGENGGGTNGVEAGSSTLSIQAFELPAETR
jgi:hypothetical protein